MIPPVLIFKSEGEGLDFLTVIEGPDEVSRDPGQRDATTFGDMNVVQTDSESTIFDVLRLETLDGEGDWAGARGASDASLDVSLCDRDLHVTLRE